MTARGSDEQTGIAGFLQKNLWAVLASMAALWSGYLSGQTTMTNQIQQINDRLDKIERVQHDRSLFMGCAVRTLDRVTSQLKTQLPCELKITE